MVPDRGFTKQLKMLDPDLDVVWDWGADRWEIWCFPKDGAPAYMVTRVQTKGKGYRELGQDLLLSIQMHRQLSADQILNYLDEHNNQLMRRKEIEFKAKIMDMAKDSYGPLFIETSQVPKAYEKIEQSQTQKILEVI